MTQTPSLQTFTSPNVTRAQAVAVHRVAMAWREIVRGLTAPQRRVALSSHRRRAVTAGRRAGKSTVAAAICAHALLVGVPDSSVVYAAMTQRQAKDVVWAKLEKLNAKHVLGWRMAPHLGEIEAPSGCRLRLIGISKADEVEKIRGLRLAGVVFDEPALYSRHLPALLREVVSPALSDLAGWMLFIGTPGPVPDQGAWHQVSEGVPPKGGGASLGRGFERYRWTVRENTAYPRFHEVEDVLAEERELNGWTEESAQYQIEWFARWVLNASALVYSYAPERNTCPEAPACDQITLAVDFGVSDPCAWVVLGSRAGDPTTYVLHAEKRPGLLPDDAAEVTRVLVERFRPRRLVGDHGGLGKTYVETWNRRFAQEIGLYMQDAEKDGKLGAIHVLNGDLAAGRVRVCPGAAALAEEWSELPWLDMTTRDEEHPGHDNHLADAALYASRVHPRPRPAPAREGESEDQARRRARMERARADAARHLR